MQLQSSNSHGSAPSWHHMSQTCSCIITQNVDRIRVAASQKCLKVNLWLYVDVRWSWENAEEEGPRLLLGRRGVNMRVHTGSNWAFTAWRLLMSDRFGLQSCDLGGRRWWEKGSSWWWNSGDTGGNHPRGVMVTYDAFVLDSYLKKTTLVIVILEQILC